MQYQTTDVERRVLAALQGGFPRSRTPYKDAAAQAGISTEQLLAVLKDWKDSGKLRRIGAIVHHEKVGLSGGAMVAWRVDQDVVERVGTTLAGFKEVSHAYERRTEDNWPYNVYTMVHGTDEQQVEQTVRQMSEACGVDDYRILTTERELKKVPPTYIHNDARCSMLDAGGSQRSRIENRESSIDE
jgi:DNA-binding Lrp family transcriptional regulator